MEHRNESESPRFAASRYRQLLEAGLASGYRFLAFSDPARMTTQRVCLLRHDVDVDVEAALRMARMEAELGIRSTYFFMLRSPVYNLFGRANWRMAREIIELGHHAGLHFDQGFDAGRHLDTAAWIALEADFLARGLSAPIHVVSFHQPGREVLEGEVDTGQRINTYSKVQLAGFQYLSDSNRQWRTADPLEVFGARSMDRFQLLIHPMWWMHAGKPTTRDAWDAAVLGNFERAQQQLLETERAYGPRRRLVLRSDAHGQ